MRNSSFDARNEKIWTLFGLKAASRTTFYLISCLFRIGLVFECSGVVVLYVMLLTGVGSGRFGPVYSGVADFTNNWSNDPLFYSLCAIPAVLLLAYFSGYVVPKTFVNVENQSRFRIFFDAVRIFGRPRLYNWMLFCMYIAALACVLIIGEAMVEHSRHPDLSFKSASDAIVIFFMALTGWHLSYHLDPLGKELSERFESSFFSPLMSVIHFFMVLAFFLTAFLGSPDSAVVFISLLLLGGVIGLCNFLIPPLEFNMRLQPIRAGVYPGLLVAITGCYPGPFNDTDAGRLLEQSRFVWVLAACIISVLTAFLYRRFIGKPHRTLVLDALKLLNDRKEQILFNSVTQGRHLICAAALHCGAGPDMVDPKGDSLLHISAWNDHPLVARVLIKFGADCNRENRVNLRPLHISASRLHPEMTILLLNGGAAVNVRDMHGRAPIHRVCSNSRGTDSHRGIRCLKMLLKHGADPDKPDHNGISPFDLAQEWNAGQYTRIIRKYQNTMIGKGGGVSPFSAQPKTSKEDGA